VSEFKVLDQIRKLVKLQEDDSKLYNVRKELEEKPALVKQLEQEFEAKKAKMKALEDDFKKIQVERSSMEGDLAQKETAITKADGQLLQLKTNKEYTAKIGEIEGIKADKSIIEEKILETYDKADAIKGLIDREKEILAKDEKEFLAKKQEIEAQIKELDIKLKGFNELRAALLDGVDKNVLTRYERILNSREGLAVVPVLGNVCGGCFMNVPPQLVNEIRKQKEIITCERCTRILYLEEDLGKVGFIARPDSGEEASIVIRCDEKEESSEEERASEAHKIEKTEGADSEKI
jgi:hypothetical protein